MTAIVGLRNELTFWPGGTAASVSNFSLNQTTDALEIVFAATDAITITRLGFRQGTLTGVAPVFRVSLQGVDGSGNPDGTIKASAAAFVDYTPTSGNNSTHQWVTLGASYACARGEMLAIVITYQSGTIDGSNFCSFTSGGAFSVVPGVPYSIQNDSTVRTKQVSSPPFSYGSAGTAYGQPCNTPTNSTMNSGSSPDERALLLNIPAAWMSSYKIIGLVFYGTISSGTTYDFVLYDTDGSTVLQNITIDSDQDASNVSGRAHQILFDESSLSTLNAGSSYRLSMKPAGTNISYNSIVVAAVADMDAYLGGAAMAQGSSRTDAGAWTDSNVTRYGINPILADITAPSGGSGGMMVPTTIFGSEGVWVDN